MDVDDLMARTILHIEALRHLDRLAEAANHACDTGDRHRLQDALDDYERSPARALVEQTLHGEDASQLLPAA